MSLSSALRRPTNCMLVLPCFSLSDAPSLPQPQGWNLPDLPPPVPLALSGISPYCAEMIRRNDDRRCNRSSKNKSCPASNGCSGLLCAPVSFMLVGPRLLQLLEPFHSGRPGPRGSPSPCFFALFGRLI